MSHAVKSMARQVAVWLMAGVTCLAAHAAGPGTGAESTGSVYLEEMTSPEVRDRVAAGSTIAIIPIGGTEQNGPHMVLGKHNVRARWLAGQIAHKLGHTVVAPVISYVPEGAIKPPASHMRFAGTLSIPDAAFESLLDGAARSLAQHGFRTIVFVGDHGGYQKDLDRVATRLNRDRTAFAPARALALKDYYEASQVGFVADLKAKGFGSAEIGTHAGLADTSLTLAVDPALVRSAVLSSGRKWTPSDGVYGDPHRASAELGQMGVQRIVESSVQAIRTFIQAH